MTTQATIQKMKFFAMYPMFGDADPVEWMNMALEQAKKGELIFDYKVIHIFNSIYTYDCYFEFSTTVEFAPQEEEIMDQITAAKNQGLAIANRIVGDDDCQLLSLNAIVK